MGRIASFAFILVVWPTTLAQAQLVGRKNLLIHFGGGATIISSSGQADVLSTSGLAGGNVAFSFAYAFNRYWSMGVHFQRMGSKHTTTMLDHVRVARYDLEGSIRLVNREHAALEATTAIGLAEIRLRTDGQRLPVVSVDYGASIGARYLRRITNTLGTYAAINWAPFQDGLVWQGEKPVTDESGRQLTLEWSTACIAVGLFVRF